MVGDLGEVGGILEPVVSVMEQFGGHEGVAT